MKKSIVILLTLVSGFVTAQTQTNEFTTALDAYFTALAKQKNFNGNILVLRNKEVFLNKSYNIENFKDSLSVKPTSTFLIASLSKIYIKYGILTLVQSGKLNLSDKLSKYLPDFPFGDKITVEHLLLNKSGLPRELTENINYDQYPLTKLVEMAKKEKLLFEPGTQVAYSNVGHFILQHIIDKASPKGVDDFMENEVFKKLKLLNTGEFHPNKKPENFVRGFDLMGGKPFAADLSNIHASASGNYYSTVADLFSFSQQLLSGKNISKSLAKKLFVKDSMLIQTGGREGYRAYYYQSIMTRVTVIFLANYTDIPFQNITEDITKILDRQPYRLPSNETRVKKAQPDEILKRYEGRYALDVDKNQIFTVTLENNNLYFLDGPEKILLTPEDEFTFFENPDSRDSFIFSLNEKTNKYDFFIVVGDVKFATVRKD